MSEILPRTVKKRKEHVLLLCWNTQKSESVGNNGQISNL